MILDLFLLISFPGGIPRITHVDLVTVDLRLSREMSYDSRLFFGLRMDW